MTIKTNLGLAQWAKDMLGQAYWMGTCCYPCTQSLLNSKATQYPDSYPESRMARYKADIAAKKTCADCVGLLKGFYWMQTNGVSKYGLDGRPDQGANTMYNTAKEKGVIATLPDVPGIMLWKSGHVGISLGNGYAIEAQGFSVGVIQTKVAGRGWTHWFKSPYIDYVTDNRHEVMINPLTGKPLVVPPPVEQPPVQEPSTTDNPTDPPVADNPTQPPQPDPQPDTPPVVTQPTNPATFGTRLLKHTIGKAMLRGDDVLAVQTRLLALGYAPGSLDSIYGPLTAAAVMQFQTDRALAKADGIVGPETRAALAA